MKYLFVAVLGLLVGVAGAAAALYYNPFSVTAAATPGPADRVFRYGLPDQVLEFSLGEDSRFLGQHPGDDSLWEETIDRTAVLGLVLNDASNQPAAVASRLLAASPASDLLLRGLLLTDYWLVTVPGEGTLFVHTDLNAWPFVKETLLPAWYFEQPLRGPAEYWPTAGPGTDNSGVALGVTGTFRGSEGNVVERYEVTTLDVARHIALATGELHLHLSGPQVAVQD